MSNVAQTRRTAASAVTRGSARRSTAPRRVLRLAVFRSNKHLVMQVIDDERRSHAGRRLDPRGRRQAPQGGTGATVAAAHRLGTLVAERAKAAGVDKVVFDRGGFLYHGRVAAAADAAREAGLEF